MGVDNLVDEMGMGEGKEGDFDRARGLADFFAQFGKSMAARIREEPKFDLLSADGGMHVAWGIGFMLFEEFSERPADEADDQIIVHSE